MKEEYHKWYSQYLNHDFEMLVFGHDGAPFILFPTSKARYYETKDYKLIESAAHLLDSGKIKIYCPDTVDSKSWYNYSIHPADRVKHHIEYEKTILFDVIGFAMHETDRQKVGIAGCSFGGYHAANIAFRHPDKINCLISMGGTFDIKRFIWGYYDDNCYFNNPPDYLQNLNDNWYLEHINQLHIILSTGEHDKHLNENRGLSNILSTKGINHWLDVRKDAGHGWHWWREIFPDYLSKFNF